MQASAEKRSHDLQFCSNRMNWDDLHCFLAVARQGQLRKAGQVLGLDATTIGRKLRRLEADVGQTLFEHRRTGHALTAAGTALLAHAEAMEHAAAAIAQEPSQASAGLSGLLRVSVSEGFGTWFIAPRLAAFTRQHPDLTIELAASSGFLNPSRKEADVAILLARPRQGPLTTRKLTDYHLGLYATPEFLAEAGPVTSARALHKLPLVSYIPDFIYAPELKYLDEISAGLKSLLRSSSINAQHQLAAAGAGVAVLPCFMGDGDARLLRVLPQVDIRRTFWLASHQDAVTTPRVRAFIDWLVAETQNARALLRGEVVTPTGIEPVLQP